MGIFGRKSNAPQLPTTGHVGDDQLLALLGQSEGGLDAPRHWLHYLYCDDNAGAGLLEAGAVAGGWTVRHVVPEHSGIIAEREDWPVNLETVPQVRAFFELLAASVPGGDYDGWEASA